MQLFLVGGGAGWGIRLPITDIINNISVICMPLLFVINSLLILLDVIPQCLLKQLSFIWMQEG